MTPLCSRCLLRPRRKPEMYSWCTECHRETETARRRAKKGTRPGYCRCGNPVIPGSYVCATCARADGAKARRSGRGIRQIDPDAARCQATGCNLPVRGDARGCRMHWPTFERDMPTIEEYALARIAE